MGVPTAISFDTVRCGEQYGTVYELNFSKYFRRMAGMTFSEYINIVRVSTAVKMLAQVNMTIGEAAFAAGFGTIRSFNRIFKRYTGFTPRELPDDFIFIGENPENDGEGFDPTFPISKFL